MNIICGIYGYHITRPIELPGLRIDPRTSDHQQAELWARDPNSYQLTAVLTGAAAAISNDLLVNLEAILSFVEHHDVLITSPKDQTNEEAPFAQFSKSIMTPRRSKGGRENIHDDVCFPGLRSSFILKALDRLQNKKLYEDTQFNFLFFKYVESIRQFSHFSDVSYYLLFSGLESYARRWAERTGLISSYSSEPICESCGKELLNKRKELSAEKVIFEFLTKNDNRFYVRQELSISDDNRHAMATYAALRNALFHGNKFTTPPINVNNKKMLEFTLFDYLPNFQRLVPLVILNEVGYSDDYIDWESWLPPQYKKIIEEKKKADKPKNGD